MSKEALYTLQEIGSVTKMLQKGYYGNCQDFIEFVGVNMLDTAKQGFNSEALSQVTDGIKGQKALKRVIEKASISDDNWAFGPLYEVYEPLYLTPFRDIPLLINSNTYPFVLAIYKWRLEVAGK